LGASALNVSAQNGRALSMVGPKLSRREREVASLVAQGMTSREIGAKLFISERTAEGHVEQIRNKLGFKSRAQIAAWVTEEGASVKASVPEPVAAQPAPRRRPPHTTSRWIWAGGGVMFAIAFSILGVSLLVPLLTAAAPGPRISTFAGTGHVSYSADDQPAGATDLFRPSGLTVSNTGEVYFAENDRIRKVRLDGRVQTIAGTGVLGFSGDGGSALAARLAITGVTGLVLSDNGDLFFSDTENDKVRMVTPEGLISTVAGADHSLHKAPPLAVGDGGPGLRAILSVPRGLVLDSRGGLLIADTGDNRIRRLDADGTISTIAGDGQAGLLGDGGPAGKAELSAPESLAFDGAGDLFIADTGNDVVRKINPDGIITTFAGNGTAGSHGDGGSAVKAQLYVPLGLTVDTLGNVYIADSANNIVRKVDLSNTITTIAGNGLAGYFGDSGPAADARLNEPLAVAAAGPRYLYIADSGNNRIRLVRLNG
jgi:DNA-binding CsgD family transcriptional regulator/sugar lactone lactonase YvrE